MTQSYKVKLPTSPITSKKSLHERSYSPIADKHYTLQIIGDISSLQAVIEKLSLKIGAIILILGAMHFFNLFVFFRLRNRAQHTSQALAS